jgi:hypothetical protein
MKTQFDEIISTIFYRRNAGLIQETEGIEICIDDAPLNLSMRENNTSVRSNVEVEEGYE